MNPATISLLASLGLECEGIDPDAPDHHQFSDGVITISVPRAGCSEKDVCRLIWHAGAAHVRKEIATTHQAFLNALRS